MNEQMKEKEVQNYTSPLELDGPRWLAGVLMKGMSEVELVLKGFE